MTLRTTVVGAGLAGCEAAWQLAERGVDVTLYDQKPHQRTPAQTMDSLLSANAGKVQTQTAAEMMQTYAMIAQQHAQDVQKLSTAFDTL